MIYRAAMYFTLVNYTMRFDCVKHFDSYTVYYEEKGINGPRKKAR